MKRITALLLCATLALSLCACSREEVVAEATTVATIPTETTAPAKPTPQEAYQAVLTGKEPFIDAYTGAALRVEEGAITDNFGFTAIPYKFTQLDLDGDGAEEMILWLRNAEDTQAGFWVLRYRADWVWGYDLTYRNFDELKEDGSFQVFYGPNDTDDGLYESGFGIGTMRFTDTNWEIDYRIKSRLLTNEEGDIVSASYTVGDQEVSSDEFAAAQKSRIDQPDAVWTYFSEENLSQPTNSPKMIDILSGNGVFYNRDGDMYTTLADYCGQLSSQYGVTSAEVSEITAVDMDQDGIKDVVLWLTGGDADYGAIILHEQEGEVQGMFYLQDQFRELKTDGTFSWSYSDAYRGTAEIDFDPSYWSQSDIHSVYPGYDGDDPQYYVNRTAANAKSFEKAITEQAAKEDAVWYGFPMDDYEELLK